MLKDSLGRPIQRWSSRLAFLSTTIFGASVISAFPVTNGQDAGELLGWDTFDRGFADMEVDPFFGADLPANNRFFLPVDIDFDTGGERVFVADLHNHRVLIFDVSGGFLTDMGAAFVLGQPDFATGAAVDTDPYEYNNNTPNPVFGCDEGVSACGMSRSFAVAYDSENDRLFASDFDNNRILVWDISAVTNGMRATWVIGQQDFVSGTANAACATGTDLACGLNGPTELALDASTQTLFVADSGNHRVLTYDVSQLASGGLGSGLAASQAIGQPTINDTAANGCDTVGVVDDCGFDTPQSIALDTNGNRLFIGDSRNSRALVFDTFAGITPGMAASQVVGQPDFFTSTPNTSCDGSTSGDENVNSCGLAIPFDVLAINVDYNEQDDHLYVSDSANSRVLVFDASNLDTNVEAIAVLGQEFFTDGYSNIGPNYGGSTSRSSLFLPLGVDYDPASDRIFVSDGGNHRIVSFGANIGGTPIETTGDIDVVDSTVNEDGSTTVDIIDDDGDIFSVTLPEGTEAPEGEDSVTVDVQTEQLFGFFGTPIIQISAVLPEGATKSVSISKGAFSTICVFDHADMIIESGQLFGCFQHDFQHRHALPPSGQCNDVTVDGDAGDNPDDQPNAIPPVIDPDGMHDIEICRNGEVITINGLRHTTVALMPDAFVGPEDLSGNQDDDSGHSGVLTSGGCNSSGRTGSTGFLLMAAIALGLRRRRASVRSTRGR